MGPIWVFPKIGVGPQNGSFIMENPIKVDGKIFNLTNIFRMGGSTTN